MTLVCVKLTKANKQNKILWYPKPRSTWSSHWLKQVHHRLTIMVTDFEYEHCTGEMASLANVRT